MEVFQYELQPYKVDLKSAFGTNHSVTNSRTNAYLLVNGIGMAEIGLPPKKEDCYFTDYQDVEQFFAKFLAIKPIPHYDAFKDFKDTKYFLREDLQLISPELSKIDQMEDCDKYLACKALVECALFDWLSKKKAIPVCEFIQKRNRLLRYEVRNFFTLSLLDDRDKVIDMIDQGIGFTPNLKIKVSNDLQYVMDILQRVYDRLIKNAEYPGLLCLDCNCSWDVATSMRFLDLLKEKPHLQHYLYMIEQPFPIKFDVSSYVEVKKAYKENNIEIYADESIKTYKDILKLQSVITGVNVKLEKSGGYRGAVMNLMMAEQIKLKKWIGVMIGSSLNANQAVNLLEFADVGADIDGSLHVTKECEKVDPIFEWGREGITWGRLKLK